MDDHKKTYDLDTTVIQPMNGPPKAPNPFDPARLRLPTDFAAAGGVKKVLTTVPVRKPGREAFIRVHPSDEYRLHTAVLELKEDREVYLVAPELLQALLGEPAICPRMLVTTITRQGALSLWPLRLPKSDGRLDDWGHSALAAAELAKDRWVRVTANMANGCYDVHSAAGDLEPPEWPDVPFAELLSLAFRDKYIDQLGHSVLQKLRGEL